MSTISSVDQGSITDPLNLIIDESSKGVSYPTSFEQQANSGENEARMKAEEALYRETSPNIKALGRKEKIEAQISDLFKKKDPLGPLMPITIKMFMLRMELLQEQLDDCKKQGIDLKEFAKEVRIRLGNENEVIPFEGEYKELKTEVFLTYGLFLWSLQFHGIIAKLPSSPFIHQSAAPSEYINPYIRVFEFEEKNAFTVLNLDLLSLEVKAHLDIFIDLLKNRMSELKRPHINFMREVSSLRLFFNGSLFTGTQMLLNHLEKKKESDLIDKVINSHVLGIFFHPHFIKECWNHKDETDPLIHFLPYLAKYASLEQVEDYFNIRFQKLEPYEKAMKWIELHIDCVHVLEPTYPEKAFSYALKAQALIRKMPLTQDRRMQSALKEIQKLTAIQV